VHVGILLNSLRSPDTRCIDAILQRFETGMLYCGAVRIGSENGMPSSTMSQPQSANNGTTSTLPRYLGTYRNISNQAFVIYLFENRFQSAHCLAPMLDSQYPVFITRRTRIDTIILSLFSVPASFTA